jgi:hypothetical protein
VTSSGWSRRAVGPKSSGVTCDRIARKSEQLVPPRQHAVADASDPILETGSGVRQHERTHPLGVTDCRSQAQHPADAVATPGGFVGVGGVEDRHNIVGQVVDGERPAHRRRLLCPRRSTLTTHQPSSCYAGS